MNDPFHLQRFVDAQQPIYAQAKAELTAGQKTSHWMWFVFPQLKGLGRSSMAQHYGIGSLDEAVAYARHPVLGPRLRGCCRLVLAARPRSAHAIFGSPDDLKLHSCLTLFERAVPDDPLFTELLDAFYGGGRDAATTQMLGVR